MSDELSPLLVGERREQLSNLVWETAMRSWSQPISITELPIRVGLARTERTTERHLFNRLNEHRTARLCARADRRF